MAQDHTACHRQLATQGKKATVTPPLDLHYPRFCREVSQYLRLFGRL